MNCSRCSFDNPSESKFCIACGAGLGFVCGKCGAQNLSQAKFCGQCGTSLSSTTIIRTNGELRATRSGGHQNLVTKDGERRHLTVLFCDLAGSTALASQMDPEDWRAAIAAYHRAAAEAIVRFGGHVAKYLGDGVMAFFGYPEAHENDAERGVRAGLAILDALSKLNKEGLTPRLSARVGLDSGAVVVGVGAGPDADVFGDAPNIAARVQSAAEIGTVMISANTQRLTLGLFVAKDCGPQVLKGLPQPIHLYHVTRPSGARGRFEAAASTRGLTPFVGRSDELRTLFHRCERAREGEGQAVLIAGEAGIGKSRLLHHFRESTAETPHLWIGAAAGAFFQNTPFHAVTEMLRQVFGGASDDSPDRVAGIAATLTSLGIDPASTVPFLGPLLNLPLPPEYPVSQLSAEEQRRRLLATLVEWIFAAARVQLLVVAIEDLHWADPSTLELIQILTEQGSSESLLLLCTARPEFRTTWPLRSHHTQITLNRLSARDIRAMIEQVAAQKALSGDTVTAVVERTGGIPLFVEELTRAVLESGSDRRMTGRAIPETLHDSLMARLDRLQEARETLQIGAILGTEFSYQLIEAVHQLDAAELQRRLRLLTDAELLYVRGIAPKAYYQFKHALIRDAAYEALLKSRRKQVHLAVARTIETEFPEIRATHPEVLARHWTEAGEIELAIAEWSRAGKIAYQRSAFLEMRNSYELALRLIGLMPESAERDQVELELRQGIVRAMWFTNGYSDHETIASTEMAAVLAEKSGQLSQLLTWLLLRCTSSLVSGDFNSVTSLLKQALDLARREGGAASLGNVHELYVATYFLTGSLLEAEDHFARGVEHFHGADIKELPGTAIAAYGWAAWNAWALGKIDLARSRLVQMTKMANLERPYDTAFSAVFAATVNFYLRDYPQAEAIAESGLTVSDQHKFPYLGAVLRCILGQAKSQLNRPREGSELIQLGLTGLTRLGSSLRAGNFRAWLAQAQADLNDLPAALATIEEGLTMTRENVFQSELLTIRGLLKLKRGDIEQSEIDYREAISCAQRIGAKSWELRATMSLASILRNTERREEARMLLSRIYDSFSEGLDSADLRNAGVLLSELRL